ncbi:MAG: hypothetical protein KGI51_06405 [Rhodospirillales bacterium]|nr:hypothetical protein [Rhodospirillales bacterium]
MALLGTGVLAIWNGIAPGAEADFLTWHIREHIPERVGVPGFLRGRRYRAEDGHPKYFNFYEAETADVFTSPAYQARLNDPTPWTRRVVATFTDTSRTPCDVALSRGLGEGSWIEAIRIDPAPGATIATEAAGALIAALCEAPGIVAAHLLRGRGGTGTVTAEAKLRGHPDHVAAWILLVEAVGAEPLRALRSGLLAEPELRRIGARDCERGLYALQFSLARADLDRAGATGNG